MGATVMKVIRKYEWIPDCRIGPACRLERSHGRQRIIIGAPISIDMWHSAKRPGKTRIPLAHLTQSSCLQLDNVLRGGQPRTHGFMVQSLYPMQTYARWTQMPDSNPTSDDKYLGNGDTAAPRVVRHLFPLSRFPPFPRIQTPHDIMRA